jgi:hypothetical protein
VTLILFTTIAPHPLTDELFRQGHQVTEALAISEVLSLAQQHPASTIIITADIDQARARMIQQQYMTVYLGTEATTADVLWELSQFSPIGIQ